MRDSSTPTVGLSLDCVFNTPEGLVPLDWLDAGDMVETYDAGFQPIERVDRHKTASNVIDLGGGVLAGQRMLAAGWAVEM